MLFLFFLSLVLLARRRLLGRLAAVPAAPSRLIDQAIVCKLIVIAAGMRHLGPLERQAGGGVELSLLQLVLVHLCARISLRAAAGFRWTHAAYANIMRRGMKEWGLLAGLSPGDLGACLPASGTRVTALRHLHRPRQPRKSTSAHSIASIIRLHDCMHLDSRSPTRSRQDEHPGRLTRSKI